MTHMFKKLLLWGARRKFRGERANFYFDLATSLQDRVSLFNVLLKLEARSRRRNSGMSPIYQEMLKGVRRGSLATALNGVASPTEQIVIDAIQRGGDQVMADGLVNLAGIVEKADSMLRMIQKAVTYPLILIVLFSFMVAGFSVFAVPVLEQLMPAEKWPPLGQALYFAAWLVRSWGVFIGLAFVGLLLLFAWSLPNWVGSVRKRFDRHLPYCIYRDYQSALLIVAISSQMRAGVSLKSSVERAISFASPWMRSHLREVLRRLAGKDSTSFGSAFATGLLSQELEDRVQDASERTDPVASFAHIGNGAIARASMTIERSAALLNNVLLVLCGLALVIMLGGFFSTAFSLQDGIKQQATAVNK
jgi:type II secretory pathway component PulF